MHNALSTPAYQRVRTRMLADIAAGAWPIGTHLTSAELERRYGVSQSPIREALLHLAGDGVVLLRAHRGATLPPLDRRTLAELYGVRGALQALTAREAATRATPAALAPLRAATSGYEAACAAGEPRAIAAANRAFHAAIDTLSGNRMAIAMLDARAALVDAVRSTCGYGAARPQAAMRQHRAIVDAIAAGEADRAAALAMAHSLASWRDLEALLPAESNDRQATQEETHDPDRTPRSARAARPVGRAPRARG
jgi:DNA-binding GntR family transcriptional regulator